MSFDRPPEFNSSVADADVNLINTANSNPVGCLEKVTEIFRYLEDKPATDYKTIRKVAAKAARRALKNLEAAQ